MTHRMFVAANPTDDVAAALERFVEPRRQDGSTLRWVHWGQWHLTLAFFGTVPGRRVDDLGEARPRSTTPPAPPRTSARSRVG